MYTLFRYQYATTSASLPRVIRMLRLSIKKVGFILASWAMQRLKSAYSVQLVHKHRHEVWVIEQFVEFCYFYLRHKQINS